MKLLKKYQKGNLKQTKNKTYTNKKPQINSGGEYAIKALQSGYITNQQIESLRKVLVKKTNRSLKIWIKITPNINKTTKAKESRMGKGKGKITLTLAYVEVGSILIETSINKKLHMSIFKTIQTKLPIKTKVVKLTRTATNLLLA